MKFTVNGVEKEFELRMFDTEMYIYDKNTNAFIVGITPNGMLARPGGVGYGVDSAYVLRQNGSVKTDKDFSD